MKNPTFCHHKLVCLSLVCLAMIGGTLRILALAGDLAQPSLGFPESIDPKWRDTVMQVLNEPSAGFRGGGFINAATTLRYGGDTEALNRFLIGLAQCPDARIQITFSRTLEANWTLAHNGWVDARHFQIQINVASETIKLEDLKLPQIVGKLAEPASEFLKDGK